MAIEKSSKTILELGSQILVYHERPRIFFFQKRTYYLCDTFSIKVTYKKKHKIQKLTLQYTFKSGYAKIHDFN